MMKRLLPALVLFIICMTAMPLTVQAFDPFGRGGSDAAVNCSGGSDEQKSTVCQTTNADPISGPNGILLKLTRIAAYIGGALAVIMIIYAGIKYITSGSDLSTNSRTDTDIESARHTLTNALLGLVVIVLAQAIITFVIRRL